MIIPSLDEIKAALLHHFGLEGELSRLPGDIDLNFKLNGTHLVKIAHPSTRTAALQMENLAMLRFKSMGSPTFQYPVPDLSGGYIPTIQTKDHTWQMRVFHWIEGIPLGNLTYHHPDLLAQLGTAAGICSKTLKTFHHPEAHRTFQWDVMQIKWIYATLDVFSKSEKPLIEWGLNIVQNDLLSHAESLPYCVCHHDLNDYNVIVAPDLKKISGVIDFGDMTHTVRLAEVAIACTYAMMNKQEPWRAAQTVLSSYTNMVELTEVEIKCLFAFVVGRLIISLTHSTRRQQSDGSNSYHQISAKPGWALLKKCKSQNIDFIHYSWRVACKKHPLPDHSALTESLRQIGQGSSPIIDLSKIKSTQILDLSVSSLFLGHFTNYHNREAIVRHFAQAQKDGILALGRYLEPRPLYTNKIFASETDHGMRWRTYHLGVDLFLPENTPVYAPLEGKIFSVYNNANELDYGYTVIIRHEAQHYTFFTLYGHLHHSCISKLQEGNRVEQGSLLGHIGDPESNGGWPPHLHFQVISNILDYQHDFPGVAAVEDLTVWKALSPNPSLLQPWMENIEYQDPYPSETLLERRRNIIGYNLSLSYTAPQHIVRGQGTYLFNKHGQPYLDMVNNVAHVGHEHPAIVTAIHQQAGLLNTNTRYLHQHLLDFAEHLLQYMPKHLEVVYVCNSGSEANELALRMARCATDTQHVLAIEHGYHGNTQACIDVSSYKFDGNGGSGRPKHVDLLPCPDPYRGQYRHLDELEQTQKYLSDARRTLNEICFRRGKMGTLIMEPILSCGGQIVPPNGFLAGLFELVKSYGGVCIADEVQTGCGRVGTHFWAFQAQNAVPDIVTIGKPIGNGHPLAVVVTTKQIAEVFDNGMEYFNTFGGNPVSCAVGNAVLTTIKGENLQGHALEIGQHLTESLRGILSNTKHMGDVRGQGLFLGVEFVKEKAPLQPAPEVAAYVVDRLYNHGILLSTDGPDHNVIKIKPPIVFSDSDAAYFLEHFEKICKDL